MDDKQNENQIDNLHHVIAIVAKLEAWRRPQNKRKTHKLLSLETAQTTMFRNLEFQGIKKKGN